MRKDNERLIASYSVNVYAPADKLDDPSGSGVTDAAEFSSEVTAGLTEPITNHINEQLTEQFSDWSDDLRCEVTPIT